MKTLYHKQLKYTLRLHTLRFNFFQNQKIIIQNKMHSKIKKYIYTGTKAMITVTAVGKWMSN